MSAGSGRPASDRARLGVLLSGRGSNFLAIHAAIERGEVPAEIAVVLSDRERSPGLARARELGLRAVAVPLEERGERLTRDDHEGRVLAELEQEGVEWVCLAGYMRLLSPRFIARFRQRIVNIHPSLLPAFPGLDAQAQALRHGVRVSGCTVHLVDEGLDSGPIVIQRSVPVLDADTVERLADRILEQEHRAYPEALRRLMTEPWKLEGRKLLFEGA